MIIKIGITFEYFEDHKIIQNNIVRFIKTFVVSLLSKIFYGN